MANNPRMAVIAHYSKSNYGNHLVNFATRRIFEECGYDVDLVVFQGRHESRWAAVKRLPRKVQRLGAKGIVARAQGRLKRMAAPKSVPLSTTNSAAKRVERFSEFSQNHLKPVMVQRSSAMELMATYARFAIGSDQIWNFDYGVGGCLFADFADKSKVVALSPSVGHAHIPAEWIQPYRNWLSGFREVGTREIEWTKSVSSEQDATKFTLLIDPTLMYGREFWSKISTPSDSASGRILLYHLGDILPEHADYVKRLSNTHSMDVIHLSDTVGGPNWETNASDFLGMIQDAACVVTDSYHGAIFAFLFNKPLVLLERHGFAGSMNTRTRTLTQRLSLTDRYLETMDVKAAMDHDYREGYQALDTYRTELWAYLSRNGLDQRALTPKNVQGIVG